MKKIFLSRISAICFIMLCMPLLLSCSSDDESPNKEGNVKTHEKRLEMITYGSPWDMVDLFYYEEESGNIRRITRKSGNAFQDVNFSIFTKNVISWYDEKNNSYEAKIVDGRAIYMTPKNMYFNYDAAGRLTDVRYSGYNTGCDFTWEGNNIKEMLKYYRENGEKISKISFIYGKYKAHALSRHLMFNPLTMEDLLDCVWENALFYTGTCGLLSENLPTSMTIEGYTVDDKGSETLKYSYEMDKDGYPTSVSIESDKERSEYELPVKISILWGNNQ